MAKARKTDKPRTEKQIAASLRRKDVPTGQSEKQKAASLRRRKVPTGQSALQKAATDAKKDVPYVQSAAQKAASDDRRGKPTEAQLAAAENRKGVPTGQSEKQKAASDRRKDVPTGRPSEAQEAANTKRRGVPTGRTGQTAAQKAASDDRRGTFSDAQKAAADKRHYDNEAARVQPEVALRQAQEYWADLQEQDLQLVWDDSAMEYDDDEAALPGIEIIEAFRTSSAAQDQDVQANNAFFGQDTLALRIIQEHNQAQLQLPANQRTRIRAVYSMMRIGRQSRDRIYTDCGPNAPNGRICPVEQEQLLFNTLQHILLRGNTALIFQRGLDGLTNPDSLEIFLDY
jgi:hypothetical protein